MSQAASTRLSQFSDISLEHLSGKVWYGETQDRVTARGYSDSQNLIQQEQLPSEAVITQFDICMGERSGFRHYWVVFQTDSDEWYSTESIGILLFQKFQHLENDYLYTKEPTSTCCVRRDVSPPLVTRISPTWERNISQLVDWMMARKDETFTCDTFVNNFCEFLTGNNISAFTNQSLDYVQKPEYKGDVSRMVFFGETQSGATPRGYSQTTKLLKREGINRTARVREVLIYSGNLENFPALTHFVIAHWWVLFQDSDGNWWSAENAGLVLLQRIDHEMDTAGWRKGIWSTKCTQRPGIMHTIPMRTSGNMDKSMEEVVEWMFRRSMVPYRPLTSNCQKFANDLMVYLSGIRVTRTPLLLAFVGPLLAPLWKISNTVRGSANRRRLRRLSGE
jgi:hypothetical protein